MRIAAKFSSGLGRDIVHVKLPEKQKSPMVPRFRYAGALRKVSFLPRGRKCYRYGREVE